MKQILSVLITTLLFSNICKAQSDARKPLSELIRNQQKGWDVISQWSLSATNKIEIFPKEGLRADSVLYKMQLAASSPIGAIVFGCGGILVDDGWIRILGSGCKQFDRNISDWNKGKSSIRFKDQSSYLLIGDDIIGGIYGMKTSGIDENGIGKVYYFGPNSLRWEATGLSYTGFINFCFSGNLESFYGDFHWSGWNEEIKRLNCDQVISCYPLLWTKEGRELKANRKIVSIQKQWDFYCPPVKNETKPISATKNKSTKKGLNQPDKSLVYKHP